MQDGQRSLAILFATFLLTSGEFSSSGMTGVHIPWAQLARIALFAFGATLLMTFVVSRQAGSTTNAEALRYP